MHIFMYIHIYMQIYIRIYIVSQGSIWDVSMEGKHGMCLWKEHMRRVYRKLTLSAINSVFWGCTWDV